MGSGLIGPRHDAHQVLLDKVRRLARRQLQPVRHPEHMGVDGDGRLDVQFIEHHAGGLAADAGQAFEVGAVQRHLAAVAVHQDVGRGDDVLGLGAEQADRGDVAGQALLAERQHLFGAVGDLEQGAGGLVDLNIRRLGRQGHGRDQLIGVGVVQFGLGAQLQAFEAVEQHRGPLTLGRRDPLGGGTFFDGFLERGHGADHAVMRPPRQGGVASLNP